MRYLLTSEGLFDFFKKKKKPKNDGLEEIEYIEFEEWYNTKEKDGFTNQELIKLSNFFNSLEWINASIVWSKSLNKFLPERSSAFFRNRKSDVVFIITKYSDEWYIIETSHPQKSYSRSFPRKSSLTNYYLCDQFDTVIKFLQDL